jgi:hypothetical protein
VKSTLGELRSLIREAFKDDLSDDPAYKKDSVLVPDDIKRSIDKWTKAMGLSSKKKKRRRSLRGR